MSGLFLTVADHRARAATLAFCAGMLALVAGCSSTGASSTGTPTTGTPTTGAAAKPTSPRTALLLAAEQTGQLNTMAASYSEQTNGSQTLSSTILIQYKPTLLVEAKANTEASGQSLSLTEIVSSKAIYLKMAELSKEAGKPWVEIPFSELKGNTGALLSQLLQNVQNNNPDQQAKMLTASKNVRSLGARTVDGVRTTEYTGSYTVASALAVLSPTERKVLEPELKQLTGPIRFSDWIDAQHHVRKTVITESVSGQQITLTTNTTAINQPVDIKLPPRRRVALIPAGSL
jgi:hypothetical protein